MGRQLDADGIPWGPSLLMADKQYDTKLSDKDEEAFQSWAQANGRTQDTADYDMRGWWKENKDKPAPAAGQHFTDKYKKPNHPTFSDESVYSKGATTGGKWGGTDDAPTFTPSKTNLENMTTDQLKDYFQLTEPGAKLILPRTKAQKRYGMQE